MEIYEAINHARGVSNKENICEKCRNDHAQLADWLEELVKIRAELERVTEERDAAVDDIKAFCVEK